MYPRILNQCCIARSFWQHTSLAEFILHVDNYFKKCNQYFFALDSNMSKFNKSRIVFLVTTWQTFKRVYMNSAVNGPLRVETTSLADFVSTRDIQSATSVCQTSLDLSKIIVLNFLRHNCRNGFYAFTFLDKNNPTKQNWRVEGQRKFGLINALPCDYSMK